MTDICTLCLRPHVETMHVSLNESLRGLNCQTLIASNKMNNVIQT